MKLNIAICDDNSTHLKLAENLVTSCLDQDHKNDLIQLFSSAEELLSEINKDYYAPDIAVLDIELGGEDGISLAKRMNQLVPMCRIIFLTGYIDYAPDAYEAEHIWFVVKKTADRYFPLAMKKALQSLDSSQAAVPGIIIREKGKSIVLPVNQILCISKVSRKSQILCKDREYYDTRRPALLIPKELEKQFIHCHQGYWVNISMIRELDHDILVLEDGTRIPISRTHKDEVRERFFDHFRSKQSSVTAESF
ncbi:MAG: LytTR family DNA-binding domain-containing protein [Erysipelotrichaceae bacterium]|nr:LytTR family DNA-binding domain-containing protein [Erysipelotrichaceae bacterium]